MSHTHTIEVDDADETCNAALLAFMHNELLHDKEQAERIGKALRVWVKISIFDHKHVSTLLVVTFKPDEQALLHHASHPVFIDVPVVEPLGTVGLDGVEKVQLFLGPFQAEFAAPQKIREELVV